MKPTYYTQIEVPKFGIFVALSDGQVLTGIYVIGQKYAPSKTDAWRYTPELSLFAQLSTEVHEFFSGKRHRFDVPYRFVCGTPFQQKIWHALAQIPYGKTTCYSALAQTLGIPQSTRAVGAAIGRNPLLVLIPCHRVVGKRDLGGFAAGVSKKRLLLDLEL